MCAQWEDVWRCVVFSASHLDLDLCPAKKNTQGELHWENNTDMHKQTCTNRHAQVVYAYLFENFSTNLKYFTTSLA